MSHLKFNLTTLITTTQHIHFGKCASANSELVVIPIIHNILEQTDAKSYQVSLMSVACKINVLKFIYNLISATKCSTFSDVKYE